MFEIGLKIHLVMNLSLLMTLFFFLKSSYAGNAVTQEVSFQVRPALSAITQGQDRAAPLATAGSIGFDLYPARDSSNAYACFEFLSENRIKTKVAAGGKCPAGLALAFDFRDQEIAMASESAPCPAPASCSPLFFSVERRKIKERIMYKIDTQEDFSRQGRIFTLTEG